MRKKRKGAALAMAIYVMVFVSAIAALLVQQINRGIFFSQSNALYLQAYYLTQTSADNAVYALTKDSENDKNITRTRVETLVNNKGRKAVETIIYRDELGDEIGSSKIILTKAVHPYNGKDDVEWAELEIETSVPDKRTFRKTGNQFLTYEGTVRVLLSDPTIQIYYLDPEQT